MGAHPKAPSLVETQNSWESLEVLIQNDPQGILGQWISRRFGGRLPFLLKILAAAAPLSIQAHPNLEQAKKGFAEENRQGVPLDAPHRNYRDDNHKPECICALEPFWVLCGFRPIADILAKMGTLALPDLALFLTDLDSNPNPQGLRNFFEGLITADTNTRRRLVQDAARACAALASRDPAYDWLVRLNTEYPGDVGVLSPLLMNLIRLEPGQALFLQPGELHAYLEGVGIELMANSDNVLRGGLTAKHIDAQALITILNFQEHIPDILTPLTVSDVEQVYPTPAPEFQLSVIQMTETAGIAIFSNDGVQILLCVNGAAILSTSGQQLQVIKGESVIIPAGVEEYKIIGQAKFFKASTPWSRHDNG